MAKDTLNEHEFELVNIIGSQLASNQRDLSKHMNLSLGMTNMLIQRMITKGYIRIRNLNKRKVEYLLTPKGFAEKMRKSIKYTRKTLNSITLIKEAVKEVIIRLHGKGFQRFYILGESDFAILVEMAIRDLKLNDENVSFIKGMPDHKLDGALLICTDEAGENAHNQDNGIDLVDELAKSNVLLNGQNEK